jgi:hypothetical protein
MAGKAQDGGGLLTERLDGGAADEVDAAVALDEAAGAEPMGDGVTPETRGEDLFASDVPLLGAGNAGDFGIALAENRLWGPNMRSDRLIGPGGTYRRLVGTRTLCGAMIGLWSRSAIGHAAQYPTRRRR